MIIVYILLGLFALVGLSVFIFVFKGIGSIIFALFGYVLRNIGGCLYYIFIAFFILALLAVL